MARPCNGMVEFNLSYKLFRLTEFDNSYRTSMAISALFSPKRSLTIFPPPIRSSVSFPFT